METRIRYIPDDMWDDFKKLCLEEKISCNKKLLELIEGVTIFSKAERKKRLQAELDELNQTKLFDGKTGGKK